MLDLHACLVMTSSAIHFLKKSSPPANTLSAVIPDTTHIQTVALDELLCHVNIYNTIERFTPLDGVTPNDNF
jgi:hypothetical protein